MDDDLKQRVKELGSELADAKDRVHELELYRASHDARIDTLWAQQHADNIQFRKDQSITSRRLTVVEKKIYWISGIAAAAGSFLPQFFQNLAAGP